MEIKYQIQFDGKNHVSRTEPIDYVLKLINAGLRKGHEVKLTYPDGSCTVFNYKKADDNEG